MFRISISGEDETSKKCDLKGPYKLYVTDTSLRLFKPKGNKIVCEWMYACIKGYGKTENAFIFECGRSLVSGEGVFYLKTKEGGAIYDAVHQRVIQMKDAEGMMRQGVEPRTFRSGGGRSTTEAVFYQKDYKGLVQNELRMDNIVVFNGKPETSFSGEDETSKKCDLKGSYKLYVTDTSLCLFKPKGNKIVCEWMYACIRGYGKTENAFMFECGRSSVSGEGVFHLKTKEGGAIYDAVHQRVTQMKDAEGGKPGQRDGGPSASAESTHCDPQYLNPRHQPSIRRENVYDLYENA